MSKEQQAETAEAKKNADAIKDTNATRHDARGNVHSETEEPAERDGVPPLPI